MTIVKYLKEDGTKDDIYSDQYLLENIERIKDSVLNRHWDYVCVVAGIPGVGKSTFAQQFAKQLDQTFNVERVCFSADEFVEKTAEGEKGQAFMLDESFADLNSKAATSPEFVKIINHLQLIRQKGLYLILILPDFFSLSKNVAIFRASNLFVVYHDQFKRGRFAAFNREGKKKLYILGKQFINYQCVPPNFRGKFVIKWVIDYPEYEKRKSYHLKTQVAGKTASLRVSNQRDRILSYARKILDIPNETLADVCEMSPRLVNQCIARQRDFIQKKYGGKND